MLSAFKFVFFTISVLNVQIETFFCSGNLAEMALEPVVPKDFPFAIRLTTQVLESNGKEGTKYNLTGTLHCLDGGFFSWGELILYTHNKRQHS